MGLTISQVRSWSLGGLTNTATGLRSGATTMSEAALTIINGLAGFDTDWNGETRDAAVVRAKDSSGLLDQRASRWNAASVVLDEAAQQLGLLRDAILNRVDDSNNQRMYVFGDDGDVALSEAYAQSLTPAQKPAAEAARAELETALRSLLATADLAAQIYDGKVTTALVGGDWPYVSQDFPAPTALPTAPAESANADGSGPDQYGVDNPNWQQRLGLQGTELWAEALVGSSRMAGQTYSPDLLEHFLGGSGKDAVVPVDSMMYDMPWFAQAAQSQTRTTVGVAIAAMPAGYTGPVAFQSDYTSLRPDGTPARPSPTSNPDWFAALGTFSYQTSGIATPSGVGTYSVAAQTSIFDYYNFETTDEHPWPQASDLNDLHRAGWAQNFNTVGTSSTQRSTWP